MADALKLAQAAFDYDPSAFNRDRLAKAKDAQADVGGQASATLPVMPQQSAPAPVTAPYMPTPIVGALSNPIPNADAMASVTAANAAAQARANQAPTGGPAGYQVPVPVQDKTLTSPSGVAVTPIAPVSRDDRQPTEQEQKIWEYLVSVGKHDQFGDIGYSPTTGMYTNTKTGDTGSTLDSVTNHLGSTPNPSTVGTMVIDRVPDANQNQPTPVAAPGAQVTDSSFDANMDAAAKVANANAVAANVGKQPTGAVGSTVPQITLNAPVREPLTPTPITAAAPFSGFGQLNQTSMLNNVQNPFAYTQLADGRTVDSGVLAALKGKLSDDVEQQSAAARQQGAASFAQRGIADSGIANNYMDKLRLGATQAKIAGNRDLMIANADKGAQLDLQKANGQDAFQSQRFNQIRDAALLPEELAAKRAANAEAAPRLENLKIGNEGLKLAQDNLKQQMDAARTAGDNKSVVAIGQLLGMLAAGGLAWMTGGTSAILPALGAGSVLGGGIAGATK